MRLLLDMNLTPRWVEFLQAAGYEAVHWSSIGDMAAPDEGICAYARGRGFALLTNDLDFPQILAHTGAAGPSVLLLRGEPLVPESRGDSMLQVLTECKAVIETGAIVTLDWSGKPRARVLPLR